MEFMPNFLQRFNPFHNQGLIYNSSHQNLMLPPGSLFVMKSKFARLIAPEAFIALFAVKASDLILYFGM
jgi:hypothetical protein